MAKKIKTLIVDSRGIGCKAERGGWVEEQHDVTPSLRDVARGEKGRTASAWCKKGFPSQCRE